MTPNELSDRVSGIAERAEEALGKAVTKTQRELFAQIEAQLTRLELDADGLILQSGANRKVLQKVDRIFNKAVKESGYYVALNKYVGNFDALAEANNKYFSFIIDSFTPDSHYLKSLQKSSIQTIETLLANDGLELQLKQPLKEILNQNINTGAAFGDMLKQVRRFIVGNADAEGKLLRYSKQISRDSLFNFSRSLQESISQKAGLKYYQYLGGIMDDSRPFCIARANKFYSKDEVESWAKLNWQGKRPGTTASTIFVYAAGFNCLHQIIPVSEAIVPKEVIERNQ